MDDEGTISLGVLAVVWLLLGGTQEALTSKFECYSNSLIVIAALCVLAIAIDLAQYVFTFFDMDSALDDSLEATEIDDAGFHDGSKLSKLTFFCFVTKLCVSGVAALWLVLVMFGALAR
jgi:hypothetical protein